MKRDIGLHIVDYLLDGGNGHPSDPVLAEWLAADASNRAELMMYRKIWAESRYVAEMESFDKALAWEKVNEINRRKKRFRRRLTRFYCAVSGAAATAAVFLALS
ncbi:MAG: anti-sigma factor, partial [Tannerella sp.]|nr:anti-sigma factor [Tannerella sp.]